MMRFKKLVPMVLALAFAVSVISPGASALAYESTELPSTYYINPDYVPERFGGTISAEAVQLRLLANAANGESGTGVMPYNNGSGTTGQTIFGFKAAGNTVYWTIDYDSAKIDDTYHYQLWRVNGNGIPDSKVGIERQCSFGSGQYYTGLIVDSYYYLVCSSRDVDPRGVQVSYTYSF